MTEKKEPRSQGRGQERVWRGEGEGQTIPVLLNVSCTGVIVFVNDMHVTDRFFKKIFNKYF